MGRWLDKEIFPMACGLGGPGMAVALKAKDHRHRPHERTSLNGVAKPERYKTHPVLGGRNGPSLFGTTANATLQDRENTVVRQNCWQ